MPARYHDRHLPALRAGPSRRHARRRLGGGRGGVLTITKLKGAEHWDRVGRRRDREGRGFIVVVTRRIGRHDPTSRDHPHSPDRATRPHLPGRRSLPPRARTAPVPKAASPTPIGTSPEREVPREKASRTCIRNADASRAQSAPPDRRLEPVLHSALERLPRARQLSCRDVTIRPRIPPSRSSQTWPLR
jgi:hypothetical protein